MNKKNKSSLSLNKQTIRQMTASLLGGVAGGMKCDPCNTGPGCTHTNWSQQAGCESIVNCPTDCCTVCPK